MDPALIKAIDSLGVDLLREVVKDACGASADVAQAFRERLFTKKSEKQPNQAGQKIQSDDPVVKRFARCKLCEKDFDVARNHDQACQVHEEDFQVDFDHDFWADTEEGTHYDTEQDLHQYFDECPEAFVYECCGGNGTAPPCRIGPHEESSPEPEPASKKRRIG